MIGSAADAGAANLNGTSQDAFQAPASTGTPSLPEQESARANEAGEGAAATGWLQPVESTAKAGSTPQFSGPTVTVQNWTVTQIWTWAWSPQAALDESWTISVQEVPGLAEILRLSPADGERRKVPAGQAESSSPATPGGNRGGWPITAASPDPGTRFRASSDRPRLALDEVSPPHAPGFRHAAPGGSSTGAGVSLTSLLVAGLLALTLQLACAAFSVGRRLSLATGVWRAKASVLPLERPG
jgi:hypothetical protein